MRHHYELDSLFAAKVYSVRTTPGIAFRVLGWETVPDEDTDWSGFESRTGQVLATMIGDDHRYRVDPDDLILLDDLAYCAECGQIGCAHDGRDREEK